MKKARKTRAAPGSAPGIERFAETLERPEAGTVHVTCIEYGPERVEVTTVEDLPAFLRRGRPAWCTVRWIDVQGLHPWAVQQVREVHPFHTLAAEDALNVPQRSKTDAYDGHVFVVAHVPTHTGERLVDEQVSLVFFPDTLITFQEHRGDIWDPVRKRIENKGSRLRSGKADYLLYALLDSIVDHAFPLLEGYGDRLETIEDEIVEDARTETLQRLYGIKRELVTLRRLLWQMRQMVDDLGGPELQGIGEETQTYLRDVHDHTLRAIDVTETYREMAAGLTDLYMSALSNRMNEIMKVLTIMASLFIPITFIAGVYGMNFEHIPELSWRWSYGVFWFACISVTGGLLLWFRRRGWIG